ncbi:gamma-glutamyltranspeptidase [Meredithblackwellia eburnea MCA 4105]
MKGAVSCELLQASEAGASMLRKGGSAVDALIASQLVVGVVKSDNSGIGGGGFALVREPTGEYHSLDFRVEAPTAAKAEHYVADPDSSMYGPLSVAVPGELGGFEALHRRWGKLAWAELFEPAIKLARDGFEVTEDLRNASDYSSSWIHSFPDLVKLFAPNGVLLPAGTIIKRPEYAQTLQTVAMDGADAFYRGEIAKSIVETLRAGGSHVTLDDFKNYKPRTQTPLSINFRGQKVVSVPAPASGAAFLLTLNILSEFEEGGVAGSTQETHKILEAMKHSYANRTVLGDPYYVKESRALEEAFVKKETAQGYRQLINLERTYPPSHYSENMQVFVLLEVKEDHGTSHLTAIDGDGLVVSVTTTISLLWGSRMVEPNTGVILNDGMADFSYAGAPNFFGYSPAPANFVAGGKRPLSSQCPFMIETKDGRFLHAGGAAGGSRILSSNIQHARNVLEYGMSPKQALDHFRVHTQLLPDVVVLESRCSEELEGALNKLGHKTERITAARSKSCNVGWNSGKLSAEGEPRLYQSGGVIVD